MDIYNIAATDETPAVNLNPETGVLEMEGKSLPEDVTQFYTPILQWLDAYAGFPAPHTNMIFTMTYFNTASSKLILDVLMKLEEIKEEGKDVKVTWKYQEDDEDMEEAGEEYSEIVDVPFDMISYE